MILSFSWCSIIFCRITKHNLGIKEQFFLTTLQFFRPSEAKFILAKGMKVFNNYQCLTLWLKQTWMRIWEVKIKFPEAIDVLGKCCSEHMYTSRLWELSVSQIRPEWVNLWNNTPCVTKFLRIPLLRIFAVFCKNVLAKNISRKNFLRKNLLHWPNYTYKQHKSNLVNSIYFSTTSVSFRNKMMTW